MSEEGISPLHRGVSLKSRVPSTGDDTADKEMSNNVHFYDK
jgi:hypothetical protein